MTETRNIFVFDFLFKLYLTLLSVTHIRVQRDLRIIPCFLIAFRRRQMFKLYKLYMYWCNNYPFHRCVHVLIKHRPVINWLNFGHNSQVKISTLFAKTYAKLPTSMSKDAWKFIPDNGQLTPIFHFQTKSSEWHGLLTADDISIHIKICRCSLKEFLRMTGRDISSANYFVISFSRHSSSKLRGKNDHIV